MKECRLCPRACGADRTCRPGICGADGQIRIARAAPHFWEEPAISGTHGAGAVFFCGCPLHCVFCQNAAISCGGVGHAYTEKELARIFLSLQEQGCQTLDLVTATPYADSVARALRSVRAELHIPVVWNSSAYETTKTLALLRDVVDVYLPDLKFYDSDLSFKMCAAPDYFSVAARAVSYMVAASGPCVFDADGILCRGTLVRHLVLPGHRRDSIALMEYLGTHFSPQQLQVSLLRQYTPCRVVPNAPELSRRVTSFEYDSVAQVVLRYGFDGYFQEKESAQACYTPPFL